jgi:hypothetical protein
VKHYSYEAYADPKMAASFDAKRFGGPIGQLLLEEQERVLLEALGDLRKTLEFAEEMGDVAGKSLVHLQCHFGLDTLSWAMAARRRLRWRRLRGCGCWIWPNAIPCARRLSGRAN